VVVGRRSEHRAARLGSIASGRGIGDDRLRVAGIYLEYGGHAENANLVAPSWPYTGWAGFQAHAIPPDEYRELCRTAARLRLRVNTTIGRELNDVLTIWDESTASFRSTICAGCSSTRGTSIRSATCRASNGSVPW